MIRRMSRPTRLAIVIFCLAMDSPLPRCKLLTARHDLPIRQPTRCTTRDIVANTNTTFQKTPIAFRNDTVCIAHFFSVSAF
ncbi:hypothetical protein HD806DRAFT_516060 [Xylariaceae sp. AK1471]|nr:hypothetical protein HD806DRAFT_516060 [Xylariaceae sp. AK1471]